MSHFLVIFDRQKHVEPLIERHEDPAAAVARLFEVEGELRGDQSRGVVLLVADDESDLRRTHSHYFKTVEELLGV
jgi:hypothetical protein